MVGCDCITLLANAVGKYLPEKPNGVNDQYQVYCFCSCITCLVDELTFLLAV